MNFNARDVLSGLKSADITVVGEVYGIDPQTDGGVFIDLAGKTGSHTAVINGEDLAGNRLDTTFQPIRLFLQNFLTCLVVSI